ncbi:hypothetical protein ABPG74_006549 [Tetrahymena malaccensis]
MACSFIGGDQSSLEKSFAESILLLNTPSKQDQMVYNFEIEKYKEQAIIHLPRGGIIIKTSIGNVQYGFPPETVKDSINMQLKVPTHFIVPSQRFDKQANLNVAEFEFPAYYNYFIHKKKINLICDPECKSAIRNAFQETLCGPLSHDKLQDDFHFSYPKSGFPDFFKERSILSGAIQDPSFHTEVDTLLSFSLFDHNNSVELKQDQNVVKIQRVHNLEQDINYFKIFDNGKEIANIKDQCNLVCQELKMDRHSSLEDLEDILKDLNSNKKVNPKIGSGLELEVIPNIRDTFQPPDFGVTVLGSSHGFDPCGHTTGFVIWCYGKGIMVDPPPFSNDYLKKMGINPDKISAIIITHCHADHDAGAFEKILLEKKIEVITTRTIMNSFLRKYSNVTGMRREEIRKLFVFRPVVIGSRMKIFGGSFNFFYSFHVIPCIGFDIELNKKSLYFSADTFYCPIKLKKYFEWGYLQQERYQQLANIDFDKFDLILHEAGVPPIHTAQESFMHLSAKAKQNLYLVHIANKDLKKELGLKIAKSGIEHTIVLIPANANKEMTQLKRLDLVSNIDIFQSLTIKNVRYLLDCLEVLEVKKGELIFPENSIGNKFFIVECGMVKIVSRNNKDFESFIGPGDYFGEISLIDESHTRKASAFAEKDCVLLTLERHDFQFLFGEEDGSGEVLKRLKELTEARKKFVIVYLEKNSLFNQLEKSQKVILEMIVKEKKFLKSEQIWKKGEKPYGIYIVKEGECIYEKQDIPAKIVRQGEFIGETLSIQRKQAVNTSLKALTNCTLLFIDSQNWIEFLDKNPGFKVLIDDKVYFK